jgi:hypothetical protein
MIQLNTEEIGFEYEEALMDVIKVRKERKKQYGNTFLDDDEIFLRFQIENKLKRLKLQFEDEKISLDPQKRETALDSLKDLCNYSIFLIAKIEQKNK